MDETLKILGEHINNSLSSVVIDLNISFSELNVVVVADHIDKTLRFLRDDPECGFSILIDICGVDYPERVKRFDVVYHLLSPSRNSRIRIKVSVDDQTPLKSVCDVFHAADWFEREAYDLYGILFAGHPDLRRILTDYGFSGYPLRKDFPLTGYHEVRYDDASKKVVYEPVNLVQEYRSFDFLSPWEGDLLPGDEKAAGEKSDG